MNSTAQSTEVPAQQPVAAAGAAPAVAPAAAPAAAAAPAVAPAAGAAPAAPAAAAGAAAPAGRPTNSTTTFQSASLYVGDLQNEITEGVLFEMFNRVGPVASIRVCRDAVTRRSLGYAYVNFHDVSDAERALDTMNFTDIRGKPCRIMWSQRDPSLRKSGVGNVFIKNLNPSIDNKQLFDTFSMFGNILSCKIATDPAGVSKGYGYVHYETAESAQEAINTIHGNMIEDFEVSVTPFLRHQDRAGQPEWTNLYAKQFPTTLDDAQLKAIFEPYGTVASVYIQKDPEGKSRGFGFVNFNDHESAEKALQDLANKSIEDPTAPGTTFELYVSRGQKKSERMREIKNRVDAMQSANIAKYSGMNLFVKNLDDSITDDFLKDTFAPFGTITSAKIMRDDTIQGSPSKGFGFVCYSSADEATRAVTELNGKILRSKPIVVTLHQRKDLRRAHLAQTYAPRSMRFPQGVQGMPMPYGMNGMYVSQPGQPFPGQQRGGAPFPFPGGPFPPRGAMGARGPSYGGYPMPAPYGMQQPMQGQQQFARRPMNGQPMQGYPQGPGSVQRRPMQPQDPRLMAAGPGRGMQSQMIPRTMPGPGRGGAAAVKFNSQVRNQGQMPPQMMGQPGQMQSAPMSMPMSGMGEPLDDQALAQADPQEQKNMIGERLYPLIYNHQPGLAGKITGMLLEMDNSELLNLIESPDALAHKIDEALNVLKNHQLDGQE